MTLNLAWNGSRLLQYFSPRKIRVKITSVICDNIVIALAPGVNTNKDAYGRN